MEQELKKGKKWDQLQLPIELPQSNVTIITSDRSEISCITPLPHDQVIDLILGPVPNSSVAVSNVDETCTLPEVDAAYANLLTDLSTENESLIARNIHSVLKGLQPYRERPSKDRSRRFAAGEIPFNKKTSSEHDVINYRYWCIKLTNPILYSAKLFLLGQILYVCQDDKPVDSSVSSCPNTYVMLDIYKYDPQTKLYTLSGRSGLLKAKSLLADVTTLIDADSDHGILLDHKSVPTLISYEPFHDDADLQLLVPEEQPEPQREEDEPYIVENIVKKRFNAQKTHYEYLVKWVGYCSDENTWELPSNIPLPILNEYEQKLLDHSSGKEPLRSGLRDRVSRKLTSRPDFIVNTMP